jgi:peptidyl-prolyl cis-trans isomerase SurA
MKKVFLSVLLFTACFVLIANNKAAKNDPVLLRVHDRVVTRSDFKTVYKKNNLDMKVVDAKSVEEYLELYINFNLKVVEAMSLGLDTNPDFLAELKTYREQLSKPYFDDTDIAENIIEEAYERLQYDIRASHILISLDRNASPSDTLEAYKKLSDIRARILAGESFEEMAIQYSDDPSAKNTPASEEGPFRRGNAGDLGYFTALNMVYPFESAAYNTPVGELTKPVRTDFGYHLIKVTDRLPAMGLARVAHIMVAIPQEATAEELDEYENRILSIHKQLFEEGRDFETLAMEYSDDGHSAPNGGEMPAFTSSRMVPEFIKAISKLDNPGQIAGPVRTNFGWHIIKLIEKNPPIPYEEIYPELKTRVSRDSRAQLSKKAVIERLKKDYKLRKYPKRITPFYSLVNDSIFRARWAIDPDIRLNKKLFSFNRLSYTQADFADYLKRTQANRAPQDIKTYVNRMFESYIEDRLIAYEDSQLEIKYPEFRNLMREYHDGILLFELTDQKVWSKAMQDTVGLEKFFEANRNNYMWDERLDVTMYSFKDRMHASQSMETITMGVAKGDDYTSILETLNNQKGVSATAVRRKLSKGDHSIVERISWRSGLNEPIRIGDEFLVVHVHEVLPPQKQEMNEIRGMLISDYQYYLEDKWVKELRNKYDIFVDYDILKSIQF